MTKQRYMARHNYLADAELRIEEIVDSKNTAVRLDSVSFTTAPPRVGEKIQLIEGKFNVIEVNHVFSGAPLKHLIVVTVERPQATVAQ